MTPSRDDVLRTLFTLVNAEQLRMYAVNFARFPHEHWPGKSASLAACAAVLVDTAAPEVWARFVEALAEPYKRRHAEIALLRRWAPGSPPRTIFAAVALDGSGVWAIGDTEQEARAGALDRREQLRDEARVLDLDFPSSATDAAWLDALALVTLCGTTEGLRATVKALDDVIPWCPDDLWDSGGVAP